MLVQCNLKEFLKVVFAGILFISGIGCQKPLENSYSLGDWLLAIKEQANLSMYEVKPYYLNIDSNNAYFEAIQACVDWEVLSEEIPIDLEQNLTKEWAAYTLINLSGLEAKDSDSTIKDLAKTRFPKEVSRAVSFGLFSLNKNQQFEPNRVLSQKEADDLLEEVIHLINHRSFQTSYHQITYKDDLNVIQVNPIEFRNEKVIVSNEYYLKKDDIITFDQNCFVIKKIQSIENRQELEVRPLDIEETIKELHLLNDTELDFSQAYIIDEPLNEPFSYIQQTSTRWMRHSLEKSHSFQISGFEVSYHLTSAGLAVEVSKPMKYGTFKTELNLNGVHPVYQLDYIEGDVKSSYFSISFNSSEKASYQHQNYKKYYGDFSQLNPKDLLNTIKSLFKPSDQIDDLTIPICKIGIPIPEVPGLELAIQLQLKLASNGKAEIVLNQTTAVGMEVRNGHLRPFNDFKHSSKNEIQADLSVLSSIIFALNGYHMNLMDVGIEAGAKAKFASQVHLYDENGKSEESLELPPDYLDEMSDGNGDLLVCAEMKAYWVLNALLNSGDSLLGKHGFTAQFDILNENNSTLIAGASHHLENGHFVEQCTRTNRERKKEKQEDTLETDQILIKKYSLIVNPGETIQLEILGLPKGYQKEDLIYSFTNDGIATITKDLTITGIESGSTILQIQTKDYLFEQKCTILVRTKENQ